VIRVARWTKPALVVATLCLAACGSPGTRVVLLPQDDGTASAVVVRSRSGEQTLSKPYERATARPNAAGAPALDRVDPAQLKQQNPALFDMVPARALHYTLYFDAGGATLTAASQQTIDELVAAARARPGGDIIVTGHTDTKGSGAFNDDLSRRRAQQIRQLLIEHQFPAARIEAVGRGERELLVPTADEVDEARNRRVTIEVR